MSPVSQYEKINAWDCAAENPKRKNLYFRDPKSKCIEFAPKSSKVTLTNKRHRLSVMEQFAQIKTISASSDLVSYTSPLDWKIVTTSSSCIVFQTDKVPIKNI